MAAQLKYTEKCRGYLANEPKGAFALGDVPRFAVGDNYVSLKIAYCGVCHTDLSCWKGALENAPFPLCPGHEITGHVDAVGKNTELELDVLLIVVKNANGVKRKKKISALKELLGVLDFQDKRVETGIRYGGYAESFVIDQQFLLSIPDKLDLAAAAPLLCAGITVYTPLHDYVTAGARVGVIGIGGLGHLAIKFARAIGYLGADHVVVTSNQDNFKEVAGTLDLILDTVSGEHDLSQYASGLRPKGRFHALGLSGKNLSVPLIPTMMHQLSWSASPVGSVALTQKMLDLAGEKNIVADIEIVHLKDIKTVFERLEKGDVRYRFVFDVANDMKQA